MAPYKVFNTSNLKYTLSKDGLALVLKPGFKAKRLGGIKFTAETHNLIFGSEVYAEVKICLYDFRKGLSDDAPAFPRFLKDFDENDYNALLNMSKHCRDAETVEDSKEIGELKQLIMLSKLFNEIIAEAKKKIKLEDLCMERCPALGQLAFPFMY